MRSENLDATTLVLLFTIYYLVERALLARYNNHFLIALKDARKDSVFFGFAMGLLITLISTPYCSTAAWSAWSSPSRATDWVLDSDAQTCLSARAVLWVSELNRLDLYPLYVVHHMGAISSLLSVIYFEWPPTTYLIILSTLASEVPGDIIWMLGAYMDSMEKSSSSLSRFKTRFNMINVAQYAFIRGAGIILVSWLLLCKPEYSVGDFPFLVQILGGAVLTLYTLFCATYVVRQFLSIRTHWHLYTDMPAHRNLRSPIQIRIPTSPAIIVVPYGFYMGTGFAALMLTSFAIAAQSAADVGSLKVALHITLLTAIAGARLFSLIMEDGLVRLLSHPLPTIFRPGFWLHGGLFGAGIGAIISHQLGYVPSLPLFAAGLAVGLPMYETFSRVGCHTYGCCYGPPATSGSGHALWRLFPFPPAIYDHPTDYAVTRLEPKLLNQPLIPIQLISATLFFLLFACMSLLLAVHTTPQLAGSVTLACHAAVRLITETCRADYRGARSGGISSTGKMALIQAAGSGLWLAYAVSWGASTPVQEFKLDLASMLARECLETCTMAALMGILAFGVHIDKIGTWVPKNKNAQHTQGSQS
jgi:prolipoprotein diacylglyceryltransferase